MFINQENKWKINRYLKSLLAAAPLQINLNQFWFMYRKVDVSAGISKGQSFRVCQVKPIMFLLSSLEPAFSWTAGGDSFKKV